MKLRLPIKGLAVVLSVITMQATVINTISAVETNPTAVQNSESVKISDNNLEETKKQGEVLDDEAKTLTEKKAKLNEYKEDFTLGELTKSNDIPEITTTTATTTAPAATTPAVTTKAEEATTTSVPISDIPVTEAPVTTLQIQDIGSIPDTVSYLTFTTYGYGHGVGLSQNGANLYATYSGYNYAQIIQKYYPGVVIQNTGTAETETLIIDGVEGGVLDLISQVCYNEMGSTFNEEAIKAQAIAAYTYAKFNGGNGNDMILKPNPPQRVVDAVKAVLGLACYYNGDFALTMFYASTGGATANCRDIFYADIPYLRSTYCEYDDAYDPNYGTQKTMSIAEIREKLESNLGITLSDNISNWFQITYGDGGYVTSVVIDGQTTVKGNTLRSYLGLKSPKFTIALS